MLIHNKLISALAISVVLLFNGLLTVTGQEIVIKNISIINVESGTLSENMDVVLNGNMIQSVSQSGSENRDPAGATIIDGTGKYLTPGFIEAHNHFAVGAVGFDMSRWYSETGNEYRGGCARIFTACNACQWNHNDKRSGRKDRSHHIRKRKS